MAVRVGKVLLLLALLVTWGLSRPGSAAAQPFTTIQEARQAVDGAWEAFHRAAISGTLKSPEVQTQLETDLHQARSRLLEAQRAVDRDDQATVRQLLEQLTTLTARIVEASREPKP